jgi:hypothetical protein
MICNYGCEAEAKFSPRKGQRGWCCSENFRQCPGFIKKCNEKKKGRSWKQIYKEEKCKLLKEEQSLRMKNNNPMCYLDPWNKGKTGVYSENTILLMKEKGGKHLKGKLYEELYGLEKSKILKCKRAESMSKVMYKRTPWNKDLKECFSKKTISTMSHKAKERMTPERRKELSKKLQGRTWVFIHGKEKTEKLIELQKRRMKKWQAAYMNKFIKNPSKPQVELFKICQKILPYPVLNYPYLNYNIDIAVPSLSLAIEYDGSYWHKDKEYDLKRQKELEEDGWVFLRYTDILPKKKEFLYDIIEVTK